MNRSMGWLGIVVIAGGLMGACSSDGSGSSSSSGAAGTDDTDGSAGDGGAGGSAGTDDTDGGAGGSAGTDDTDGGAGNGGADDGGADSEVPACAVADPECGDSSTSCVATHCEAEGQACEAEAACDIGNQPLGSCLCEAQLGTGTMQECFDAFTQAGGQPAIDLLNCVRANCAEICGL